MQFHSTEMIVNSIRRYATLSAVGATIALATASMAAAQDETCGAYKYHDEHTGRCVDARDKPSGKTWAEEMLAKKWAP